MNIIVLLRMICEKTGFIIKEVNVELMKLWPVTCFDTLGSASSFKMAVSLHSLSPLIQCRRKILLQKGLFQHCLFREAVEKKKRNMTSERGS